MAAGTGMMQQAQPKKRGDEGRCHNRPFVELAYSLGWNNALYQFGRRRLPVRTGLIGLTGSMALTWRIRRGVTLSHAAVTD